MRLLLLLFAVQSLLFRVIKKKYTFGANAVHLGSQSSYHCSGSALRPLTANIASNRHYLDNRAQQAPLT